MCTFNRNLRVSDEEVSKVTGNKSRIAYFNILKV